MQLAWGNVGNACGGVGQNYTSLGQQLPAVWQGPAGRSAQSRMADVGQMHADQQEASGYIAEQLGHVIEVGKATLDVLVIAIDFIDGDHPGAHHLRRWPGRSAGLKAGVSAPGKARRDRRADPRRPAGDREADQGGRGAAQGAALRQRRPRRRQRGALVDQHRPARRRRQPHRRLRRRRGSDMALSDDPGLQAALAESRRQAREATASLRQLAAHLGCRARQVHVPSRPAAIQELQAEARRGELGPDQERLQRRVDAGETSWRDIASGADDDPSAEAARAHLGASLDRPARGARGRRGLPGGRRGRPGAAATGHAGALRATDRL